MCEMPPKTESTVSANCKCWGVKCHPQQKVQVKYQKVGNVKDLRY